MQQLQRIGVLGVLLVAACSSTPVSSGPERAKIAFLPSPGWCRYSEAALARERIINEMLRPSYEYHDFYADCPAPGMTARTAVYFNLAVFRAPNPLPLLSRDAFLDQVASLPATKDTSPAEQDYLRNAAKLGLVIEPIRDLGVVGRDANAVYTATLNRVQRRGAGTEQINLTAMTRISGRVVFLNFFGEYRDDESINTVLRRARSEMARLIEANP